MNVRHAEPIDHAPIIAVVDAWWGGRPMAALLPKLFFVHFRPTSFVIEDDGALRGFLVGFVSQTDPSQAYIHFVGIDPAYRGRGLGRLLYEHFFDAAKRRGCSSVSCITSPVNTGSIAFHRHLGFQVMPGDATVNGISVTTRYGGQGEPRVLLWRQL